MSIASVIGGIHQRFIAMFAPVFIQSLRRDQCQKPNDVIARWWAVPTLLLATRYYVRCPKSNGEPGRGTAHHCLFSIASVIGGIHQRFIAMFAPVFIQSLGRDQCQKPNDVIARWWAVPTLLLATRYYVRCPKSNVEPGRVGTAHHCLMSIASVIGGIHQRFMAMFAPVFIQSLGRDQCQKPNDVIARWWAVPTLLLATSPHTQRGCAMANFAAESGP